MRYIVIKQKKQKNTHISIIGSEELQGRVVQTRRLPKQARRRQTGAVRVPQRVQLEVLDVHAVVDLVGAQGTAQRVIQPHAQQFGLEIAGAVFQQPVQQHEGRIQRPIVLRRDRQVVQRVGRQNYVTVGGADVRRQHVLPVGLVTVLIMQGEGCDHGAQVLRGQVPVTAAQPRQLQGAEVSLHLLFLEQTITRTWETNEHL